MRKRHPILLIAIASAVAVTSAGIASARFGEPVSMSCPAGPPEVVGGQAEVLVELPVTIGTACYYPGLRRDFPARSVRLDADQAATLADILNDLKPVNRESGVVSCPMDQGEYVLALLRGEDRIQDISIHIGGCGGIWNGTRSTYSSDRLYKCLFSLFPGLQRYPRRAPRPTACSD